MNERIDEILKFWFEETTTEQKYIKDEKFDKLIRDKYSNAFEDVVKTNGSEWQKSSRGSLAAIIVLDQFSRNMFRDDAKSFAYDNLALEIAEEMVASGMDKEVPLEMRSAVYMPYMHSESKDVHKKALKLFQDFAEESNEKGGLEYEIKHKAIIDKFGRYPHRNEVLGRESTPEEIEFNNEHGGF